MRSPLSAESAGNVRACPGPDAVAALLRAGARIVASTDSHVAADVGRYQRVPAILDEAARVASQTEEAR